MRTVMNIAAAVTMCGLLAIPTTSCSGMGKPARGEASELQDANRLVDYYGFDELEMVKLDWAIHSLLVADFDGDGRNDMAAANNVKSKIELLIQKDAVGPGEIELAVDPNDLDINALVAPTRFDRQNVTVSQRIYSMVCGDLDSDGLVDLAYYGEPRGLYILLQDKGEGPAAAQKKIFWKSRKKIQIDDGLASTRALVCADLNADGKDDLALAGRNTVHIILQKDDGTLAEPLKYPSTAGVVDIEVGDIDGDRLNDLVIQTDDAEKPIHVRFGLKTKQLGPCVQFYIEHPRMIQLCDIDGATGDELVTIASVSKRLLCYKYADKLDSDSDWPALLYPLPAGDESAKRDMVLADIDGDRLTDVVISDPGAAELVVYLQTRGLGLTEPARFPAFADVQQLSAADVDGDGQIEIGMVSVKEKVCGISAFENERLTFPKALPLAGEPVAMELACADGDKSVDCVYVCRSAADVRSFNVLYDVGNPDSNTSVEVVLTKLTSNPDALKVLDVDQDGLNDVLVFVRYELPILLRQTANRKYEIVEPAGAQASLIKEAAIRSIALADVDGKSGRELLVAQNNFARALVFSAGKGWTIIDQYNARGTENRIAAVGMFDLDLPGSRAAEVFLLDGQKGQLQILSAQEDGAYRFSRQVDVGPWSTASQLKLDCAALTGGKPKSILLFDGEKFAVITPPAAAAAPRLIQTVNYETKIKDGAYGNLAAGDINSDKRVDITMVEYNGHNIEILAADGGSIIPAMRFKVFEQKNYRESEPAMSPTRAGVEPRELAIADVTGDGADDLICVVHDRIIVYPQD